MESGSPDSAPLSGEDRWFLLQVGRRLHLAWFEGRSRSARLSGGPVAPPGKAALGWAAAPRRIVEADGVIGESSAP